MHSMLYNRSSFSFITWANPTLKHAVNSHLELLVGQIDQQLFEAVDREDLGAKDVEDRNAGA